jgi:hypothetical protein
MCRLAKILVLFGTLALVPTALAASGPFVGSWRKLPQAPAAVFPAAGAWTGKQLLVVGRRPFRSVAVAESYDPARHLWRRLGAPPALGSDFMCCKAVWTGKEVLVWGAFAGAAFNPATGAWRTLPRSVFGGIVVWTGREAIGWGGGCCGDARSNGTAYDPAADSFRKVAASPLAPSQSPVGAWSGRELLLFVSGIDPDGKPYPASLARAAAYNPTTNAWRRLAAMPAGGGRAVWTGNRLLVAAAGTNARATFAFDPASDRWRRLASSPVRLLDASAVWTGRRLLVWTASRGFAYDPATDRWSAMARWPLRARSGPLTVWTGRSLIVWGGEIGTPLGTSTPPKFPTDGAAFTPMVK